MRKLRYLSRTVAQCMVLLPLCSVAAESTLLAEAAEQFAEQSLALPAGSAHAQSIDRQLFLGRCESGWIWSFPYEARTTVQVSCMASPLIRRFVSMRYDAAAFGSSIASSQDARQRHYVAATRDLVVGHVLSADDLEISDEWPKARPFSSTLSDPASLIGLTLTRSIRRGEALGRADARPGFVVKRNAVLTGRYSFPGGQVYAKLVAMENGKAGDWIGLENPQSGRRLKGRVLADGTVEVSRQAGAMLSGRVAAENFVLSVD